MPPVIGGVQTATESLCAQLVVQGVDVVVLTRRYRRQDAAQEIMSGVRVRRLGLPGSGKLHALTFALHTFLVLATGSRSARIVHVQNIDTPMLVGLAARVLLRRRLVATIHGESKVLRADSSRLGRLRLRAMLRFVDRYTCINPEVRRTLASVGAAPTRLFDIPNGIDLDRFHPATDAERGAAREALGLPADAVVVLFLGRLHPVKRVDLLIRAWARLDAGPGARLIIVGDGPLDAGLRDLARETGVDARFDGPTSEVPTYLRAADVFVLPTGGETLKEHEGLSVALMEAMTAGLTAIVTPGPGNDVLVPDERFGLRFAVGDPTSLAVALGRAISSPGLREQIGREAHERIASRYGAAVVARETIAVYEGLTSG